jgi:hypothetical protein
MVTRSIPHMNLAAITALVDRWRPKTHSFHLRTGEMTVTLEDIAMILAVPIEGSPLCIDTSCDDWCGKMVDRIGKCPEDTLNKDGVKLRVAAGATFKWISDNFNTCLRMPMRMSSRCTPTCTCGMLSPGLCSMTLVVRPRTGIG